MLFLSSYAILFSYSLCCWYMSVTSINLTGCPHSYHLGNVTLWFYSCGVLMVFFIWSSSDMVFLMCDVTSHSQSCSYSLHDWKTMSIDSTPWKKGFTFSIKSCRRWFTFYYFGIFEQGAFGFSLLLTPLGLGFLHSLILIRFLCLKWWN